MNGPLDSFQIWRSTLASKADHLESQRETLRQSFLAFRSRVSKLVENIGCEIPGLTVHDITHLDALWRVADQIAGEDYPLNPAEAYVLGGGFLLHDAAHVLAAYPRGLEEIRETVIWQDLIAQKYDGIEPEPHSAGEKAALFQVLRHLHAEQGRKLASLAWELPGSGDPIYLIESLELRNYYGNLIGEVAASHHWPPELVANNFSNRKVPCPAFLSPAVWEVDVLKIALLLRTADAAHLDDSRAPWFLFSLRQPEGISELHWRFQAKIGQPTRTTSGELRISTGAPFSAEERDAWWLAFDTARMVDRELRAAHDILRDEGRPLFAAASVLGIESPQSFSKQVPVQGWVPVDASPRVRNLPQLIGRLGGAALYGDNLAAPLRELLQNGLDAVRALRALDGLGPEEGEVSVTASPSDDGNWWLSVADTGIGMSRYVLTNVLLDFGTSLWAVDDLREELPGLAKAKFSPVGKFGIGFFSVFMLGREVRVTTRRFEPGAEGQKIHWQLRFENGLASRPALFQPPAAEQLTRSGTRVAVKLSKGDFDKLVDYPRTELSFIARSPKRIVAGDDPTMALSQLVISLCPASLVTVSVRVEPHERRVCAKAEDWKTVDDETILKRAMCHQAPIVPLMAEDGRLLGRAGLSHKTYLGNGAASLVYEGVLCGRAPGLVGIVEAAENNSDAGRQVAGPCGKLTDWASWARRLLAEERSLDREQMVRLHPLVPELDLPVWEWQRKRMTLGELIACISMLEEFAVHEGLIDHSNDLDDVSAGRFSQDFRQEGSVICVPEFNLSNTWGNFFLDRGENANRLVFPWSVGAAPIDYQARLASAIGACNIVFSSEKDDWYMVGNVDGIEIYREVEIYKRPICPSRAGAGE